MKMQFTCGLLFPLCQCERLRPKIIWMGHFKEGQYSGLLPSFIVKVITLERSHSPVDV